MAVLKAKVRKSRKSLRLDLGCGINPREGFEGVDIVPGGKVTHAVDLFQFPWPFEDGSVAEVNVNHFAEHIPHYRPEYGQRDGWWLFWEEVQRICKPGALIHIVHPYVKSDRAFWDPTHVRFIHEVTWYYLDPIWRTGNGLDHYTSCNFEVVVISGVGVSGDIATRTQEYQDFARAHYWNTIPDLTVELKRR